MREKYYCGCLIFLPHLQLYKGRKDRPYCIHRRCVLPLVEPAVPTVRTVALPSADRYGKFEYSPEVLVTIPKTIYLSRLVDRYSTLAYFTLCVHVIGPAPCGIRNDTYGSSERLNNTRNNLIQSNNRQHQRLFGSQHRNSSKR